MKPSATAASDAALHDRARRVMPGGVSSPVRAFGAVGGAPVWLVSGTGTRVRDRQGRSYLDFMSSWGPLILGHAHPRVVEAVQSAAARGTSFGTPCEDELALAERVTACSPVAERVRFVNSGTEATMSALRLARAATGRDAFVKFAGCYHGHGDAFLVQAGSGLATSGESSSLGVPAGVTRDTGVLPLDDESALEAWFDARGAGTAAVFLEALPANCGLLPQRRAWLDRLRALCTEYGSLLVVDEVITGFRLGPGGFCGTEDYPADVVTYGKVIGGGLPVGAYGARAELMDLVSPDGGVYQAGTLSGNPLGMAAGLATLRELDESHGWVRLAELGEAWERRLAPLIARECAAGHPVALCRVGSLFWLCFGSEVAPRAFEAIPEGAAERYRRFFHALLTRGVMIAPSAFEVGFLNTAMTGADLDEGAAAFDAALEASR